MIAKHCSSCLKQLVVAAIFLTAVPQLYGQFKVKVDKPAFENLQSPDLGGEKNFKPKDWLEVEVSFTVEAADRDLDFVDRVDVRWYVAVQNPEGKGYWMLEKSITHVNVPVDEEIYTSVYISPNGVKRLSGKERAGKSIVFAVGGEINVNGARAVFTTKGSESKPFWSVSSSNISRTEKVPLLNKAETPFKALWWDRYAEIEERR